MANTPLFLSLVALIVAIIALLVAQKAKDKASSSRIRHYALEEFKQNIDEYVEQKIRKILDRELNRCENKETSSTAILNKKEQPNNSLENPNTEQILQLGENQVKDELTENSVDDSAGDILPISMYVGSYKTGSFKYFSPSPDDKTIYCITINDNEAVEGQINIERTAYDKVVETPDYLEGACIVSGNGTQIKVCKPGTVFKENGQWIVKEQIEVELV